MDLIAQNAEDWNIDTEKVVLCGFSAGGHLAASYCTLRDLPEITEMIAPKAVQAAILAYPVITAREGLRHTDSFRNLAGEQELTKETIGKFSLECHVRHGLTPPTFLWHTAADELVPVQNSLLYAQALAEQQIPFELHIFPAGEHGLSTSDRQTLNTYMLPKYQSVNRWIPLAQAWLKQELHI